MLNLPNGAGQSFSRADEFVTALSKALTEAADIEVLFAIWERNVEPCAPSTNNPTALPRAGP